MKINKYLKRKLTWMWAFDCYFYSLAFPVIMWIINKERSVTFYVLPSIIMTLFGGSLNAVTTSQETVKILYEKYFIHITVFDSIVWLVYFAIWMLGLVPDSWYPIASAIMHVSTVQLSITVREELKNRIFPISKERTEFAQANHIAHDILGAMAGITLLIIGLKSFNIARWILVFAMVIDNVIMLGIHYQFEKKQ